jgi:F0F1-type ATP synthase assembly protein I
MAAPSQPLDKRGRPKKAGGYPLISRKAGILVAMALELPGSIAGGLFLGYLLDQYFNTSPWLMMALTILGFTGACMRLVRWVRFYSEKRNQAVPGRDHSAD